MAVLFFCAAVPVKLQAADTTEAALFSELEPFDFEDAQRRAEEVFAAMRAYEAGAEGLAAETMTAGANDAQTEADSTQTGADSTQAAGDNTESEANPADMQAGVPAGPDIEVLDPEEFFALYGDEESFCADALSQSAQGDEETLSAEGISCFYTDQAASDFLRERMIKRASKITFDMVITSDLSQLMTMDKLRTLPYKESVTGKPCEGDYLFWNTARWQMTYERRSKNKIRFYVYVTYFSTAAQEKYVDQFADLLIQKYDLNNPTFSPQKKIRTIYWFMTTYFRYDYEHVNDVNYLPMRSAYGLAHDQKAVCQGFANMFYYLMKKLNVPVRTVTSETHAWNIVGLAGKYFNVDATWDAGIVLTQTNWYHFFMKTDADIMADDKHGSEHIREARCNSSAFYFDYPMTDISYPMSLWYFGGLLGSTQSLTTAAAARTPAGTPATPDDYGSFALVAERTSNLRVKLSWSGYPEAARYDIYAKSGGSDFMWQASVRGYTSKELQKNDDGAVTYYVSAVNSEGYPIAVTPYVAIAAGIRYPNVGIQITDGIRYFKITAASPEKCTVSLVRWNSSSSSLVLPDTISFDGLTFRVTDIAKKAVKKNRFLKTLVLGKELKSIGANAFAGCSNLSTVEVRGTKLKKIGKKAFAKTAKNLTIVCKSKKKKAYLKKFKAAKKGGSVLYGKLK